MDEEGAKLAKEIDQLIEARGYVLQAKPILNSNGTLGAEAALVKKVIEEVKEEIKG